MEDRRGIGILVLWRVERAKKLDFALDFCCLDAVFSKGKETGEEEAGELGDRLFLQEFSALLRSRWFFHRLCGFSPLFLPGFAPGLLVGGRQVGQMNE